MPWWPRSGLWRHRDFLRLWAAQAVSALGSRITRTALPVIAVLAVDGSALELGVLAAVAIGPGAVVGLLAGGAIDRAAKRPVLIGADLARALLVLSIPLAAWLGVLTMTQLYLVAGAVGCASALFGITDNAYLPALVAKQQLLEANAKLETTESVAEVTGPGLAGLLIELLTAPVAMLVDAASYLWSAAMLARIRASESPALATAADDLTADLRAGLRACWTQPLVRPLLLATAVSSLSGGFFSALYMLYTLDVLGMPPGVVGVIISAGGAGSLFGALLSTGISRRLGAGAIMLIGLLVYHASGLLIPLASGPGWRSVALLTTHQLLGDGFFTIYFIQAVSLRQSVLPADLLARTNAVFTVASSLLLLSGALLGGAAGQLIGIRPAISVGVACGLLAPLMLLPLLSQQR